jgi:hypothetical protein
LTPESGLKLGLDRATRLAAAPGKLALVPAARLEIE